MQLLLPFIAATCFYIYIFNINTYIFRERVCQDRILLDVRNYNLCPTTSTMNSSPLPNLSVLLFFSKLNLLCHLCHYCISSVSLFLTWWTASVFSSLILILLLSCWNLSSLSNYSQAALVICGHFDTGM